MHLDSFFEEGIILLQKYVDDPSKVQASQQESMLLQRLLDVIDDEGNSQVWHGQADILANGASIAVGGIELESPESSPGRTPTQFKDPKYLQNQLTSQTVCFSFLQGQRYPEFTHKLVPSISISRSDVMIYIYDSVKDKLL